MSWTVEEMERMAKEAEKLPKDPTISESQARNIALALKQNIENEKKDKTIIKKVQNDPFK